MSGQTWRGLWRGYDRGLLAGCGGGETGGRRARPPAREARQSGFISIGFDASEPLVDALQQGSPGPGGPKPLRMGELSVKTMVKHLEKQAVEAKISTGETLVTPRT